MLPGCWLLAALLLAPGSWGSLGQCPSCEEGAPPACAPWAGCQAPEREAAAPPDSAKAPWDACGEKGCARALGEACGVYTPSCARGLRCIPRAGERAPLHALLHGKGVCRAVGGRKGSRSHSDPEPPAGESWKESRRLSQPTLEPLSRQHHGPLTEANGSKDRLHQISLNSNGKPDLETAPCRMHLATVMLELKAPLYRSGEDIFIPNCDTKGFYRKKQCRASKGQRRGQCWEHPATGQCHQPHAMEEPHGGGEVGAAGAHAGAARRPAGQGCAGGCPVLPSAPQKGPAGERGQGERLPAEEAEGVCRPAVSARHHCRGLHRPREIRFLMKSHSFLRETGPGILHAKLPDGLVKPPAFSTYLYFLFCPTLIYRESYPRTPIVRWNYVAQNFAKFLGCLFYIYFILERLCIPVFTNMSKQPFSTKALVLSVFNATLPGTFLLLLFFFAFLHCWLNAFAEMLRFADRAFYKDWWNSTSFATYYRTWNVVVHDWLYYYIYQDLFWLFGGKSRVAAMLSVFITSAVVHEYVITLCFGFFYPVMFTLFAICGVTFNFLLNDKRKSPIWNIIMWTCLFMGLGIQVCLYCQEWYAQIHCPLQQKTLWGLVTPRSWSCQS